MNKTDKDTITIDDLTLVRKCKAGDTVAMKHLILRYQDRIYNLTHKICQNPEDAAELTQETFVKVIQSIRKFKENSSFYTWLFRIAVNLTINHCRRKFRISTRSLDAFSEGDEGKARQLKHYLADSSAADPALVAQDRESVEILNASIAQLDEKQRTILVLRDIEGMPYAKIADTLEVEIGTVKSRISRARKSLREILDSVIK
ncbi:RNA polymerase sigma factor [Anaerohalosphaera lusitana]|uniref:RNA polymerase sigma factor n=1 Tax=Anaerohalosphaera lusitana TaxID=1936003 RepID=UPI0014728B5B|nr:sigma-70 family RNA polymerase sigma factor [Anaerohalosphaera lusitana]